jgi:2-phosphosulfolactate phosphatase
LQGVHPDDVALCLELDRFLFAMVAALEDSLMVLRPRAMPAPAGAGLI